MFVSAPVSDVRIRPDNAPRFVAGSGADHYESWFLRANDPGSPRAVWLKATILQPRGGEAIAESWCALFGMGGDTPWAAKATVPRADATFAGEPLAATIGASTFNFDTSGASAGELVAHDGRRCAWELRWEPVGGALAQPLSMFPLASMVDGPFPRNKLLTPAPCLRLYGWVQADGERVELDGWHGMQGHNWGRSHAPSYAWGHCVFEGADGEPLVVAEGFTGRIRLAGRTTPAFSGLVVRRGDREWRFDRLVDLWRQQAKLGDLEWNLHVRGAAGDATLTMRAEPSQVVCLGYFDPDGGLAYCLNSKLARAVLRLNPADGDGFECVSAHGGALEILTRTPDSRFPVAA